MRQRLNIAAGTLFIAAGLLGCEDAGKKPVQARVPALGPAGAAQAPAELALLPVQNPPHRHYVWLLTPIPTQKDYLIQRVQEKFASGEQNFKAGHLEAARKDFDDAVDGEAFADTAGVELHCLMVGEGDGAGFAVERDVLPADFVADCVEFGW